MTFGQWLVYGFISGMLFTLLRDICMLVARCCECDVRLNIFKLDLYALAGFGGAAVSGVLYCSWTML